MERLGERISTLARLFNVREGFYRAADTLPARNLIQPLTVGSAGGQVVDLEPMLDEYYRIMGWTDERRSNPGAIERAWNIGYAWSFQE